MKAMKQKAPKLRMRAEHQETSLAEIIKVDEVSQRVDAMTLHQWLGVRTAFRHWIKRRVEDCRLVDGADYWAVKSDRGGIIESFDEFWLTLAAAEMMSMMERSERGHKARIYFVGIERRFFRIRDELVPQLQLRIHNLERMLGDVTAPKIRRRAGKFVVAAYEKFVHTDVFGLVTERLVKVMRPYDELSSAEREVYAAKHRQLTMTGLSRAQTEAFSKLMIVPSFGLLPKKCTEDGE